MIQDEQALMPDLEQRPEVEDTPLLDLSDPPPPAVADAPNQPEVIAQIALADDTIDHNNFGPAIRQVSDAVARDGIRGSLDKVAGQERVEVAQAHRDVAEQAAATGNAALFESAVREMYKNEQKSQTQPTRREGNRATSERALEILSSRYATRYNSLTDYAKTLEGGAEQVSVRNMIAAASASVGDPTLWDKISHFIGTVLPSSIGYEVRAQNALDKYTGQTGINPLHSRESVLAFRTMLQTMDVDERQDVLKALTKEAFGLFGQNKAATQELLRKLMDMTYDDAVVDTVFNSLSVVDGVQLMNLASKVVRAAAPINVVRDVAGAKEAAKIVAHDLMSKSAKVGGLNDAELMARYLSNGRIPMGWADEDWKGMSAAAQAELRANANRALDEIHNTIRSGGHLTEEQVDALNKIRDGYLKNTDPAVHSVIFGEGSVDGQKLTVFYQNRHTGTAFRTYEAALAEARARGLPDDAVVREVAATPTLEIGEAKPLAAFHGGTATDTLDPYLIGSGQGGQALGRGFYMSTAEDLAEKYAQKYGHTVSRWDVPDTSTMVHWYEQGVDQPDVVKNAFKKLLGVTDDKLANTTGQDLYTALKDKLGEKKVGEVLRNEGVTGNYASKSGPHGVGPELVLYSGKDAKHVSNRSVDKVTRVASDETVEVDGEVFFKRDGGLRQPQEVQDWAALVESYGKASPSAVSPLSRGEPLFRGGRTLEISDWVPKKVARLAEEWIQMLGYQSQRFVIATNEDLPRILSGLGGTKEQSARLGAELLAEASPHMGLNVPLKDAAGRRVHVILLNRNLVSNASDMVSTLGHELGHSVKMLSFDTASAAVKQQLIASFRNFTAKHAGFGNEDFRTFEAAFRSPTSDFEKNLAARKGDTLTVEDAFANVDTFRWYNSFDEWFAENVSKWLQTSEKPLNAVEQFFKDYATKVKALFQRVAKAMGVDTNPDAYVQKFMDDHLRKAGDVSQAGHPLDNLMSTGKDTVHPMMAPYRQEALGSVDQGMRSVPAGKPRIKLKVKEHTGGPEGWVIRDERIDPLAFASLGKFTPEDIKGAATIAVDPKHGASELAVAERVVGLHAQAKMRKDLVNMVVPFFDRIGNEGRAKVMRVLEEGDAFSNPGGSFGREFTYPELVAKGLTEPEAQAYFAARQARMVSWHIRNGEMVRTLRADGYKEIELLATGEKLAGRVFTREQANQPSLGRMVWDATAGKEVRMDSTILDAVYGSEKMVIQLKEPVKMGSGRYTMMVVDKETAAAREIRTAINYRPGEFARIYTDEYFIKAKYTEMVDGAPRVAERTVRTAATKAEAEAFVAANKSAIRLLEQEAAGLVPRNKVDADLERLIGQYDDPAAYRAAFEKGELDGFVDMYSHYTRNKDEYLNLAVNEASHNGRLFVDKREGKLFSTDKDRRNTLNVFESLEAEITNVSRVANISQWRESMVRRWMNTFGDRIPNRTGNDVADFYAAAGTKFTGGTDDLFATRTHAYIMRQLGTPTAEEKYWQGTTRMLTESLMGKAEGVRIPTGPSDLKKLSRGDDIETVGAKIRGMGWLGFVRNINFNLNLGMFNPAQLLVQANGAAASIILSPVHGLGAAYTAPLLRMALMSDNPEVWRKLGSMEKAATLGLSNPGEFVDVVKAIRRSGLLENTRSTALYNMEDGALNIFNGYPRRALEGHAFFFNRGEEFARLVSFEVARKEWMTANKGLDWRGTDALKAIIKRQDDLTQNMTGANKARWQEGVLSIPFQFAQYNIKLGANIMSSIMGHGKRGFTRTEAATLLAGHAILYGAAGNGLMGLADEMFGGDKQEGMSQSTKLAIGQGAISWAFDAIARTLTGEGANVAMGSRLGSFDYYKRIAEAVYKDPAKIHEAILGPTLGTAKRLDTVVEIAKLWWRNPNLTSDDVVEGLVKGGAEQVAVLRNATKAYLYYQNQGMMVSANSSKVGRVNSNEILMQALGFQPAVAVDLHHLLQNKKDHKEVMNDLAQNIIKTQREMVLAANRGDMDTYQRKQKFLQALWPTNVGDYHEVRTMVQRDLFPHDSEFQKALGDFFAYGGSRNKPLVITEEPKHGSK